jgi:hypothetical protein
MRESPYRRGQCCSTMQKLLNVILVFCFASCGSTSPKGDKKILDFGKFTIETPTSWSKIEKNGIDSYVGAIVIDSTDTLSFDLGWYSNRLNESEPTFFDSSMIGNIDTSLINISDIIFVKDRMLVDPDMYKKNNVTWDTIDGRRAKIVHPRQSGNGTTGIYIDSLWISGSDVDRFNLYGTNLKIENEKKVLKSIRTLKFHRNK